MSMSLMTFGPPARLRRILISRLIFFFATGFKTLMTQDSSLDESIPSKTWVRRPDELVLRARRRRPWHAPLNTSLHRYVARSHIYRGHSSLHSNSLSAVLVRSVPRATRRGEAGQTTDHSHTRRAPNAHSHQHRHEPSSLQRGEGYEEDVEDEERDATAAASTGCQHGGIVDGRRIDDPHI